jgi:hypothetical protein
MVGMSTTMMPTLGVDNAALVKLSGFVVCISSTQFCMSVVIKKGMNCHFVMSSALSWTREAT